MKLASNRIYQVLPQRLQEWSLSPCSAEEANKKALEQIRSQQIAVQGTLLQLDKRHKELDLLVDRAKLYSPVDPEPEEEDDSSM